MKLTVKQLKFIEAYFETHIASHAYRIAYNTENMKQSTIYVKASELLNNPKIAKEIKRIQDKRFKTIMERYSRL